VEWVDLLCCCGAALLLLYHSSSHVFFICSFVFVSRFFQVNGSTGSDSSDLTLSADLHLLLAKVDRDNAFNVLRNEVRKYRKSKRKSSKSKRKSKLQSYIDQLKQMIEQNADNGLIPDLNKLLSDMESESESESDLLADPLVAKDTNRLSKDMFTVTLAFFQQEGLRLGSSP
jgi:hypothetical protein